MEDILKLAEANQKQACLVIERCGLIKAWEKIGAKVNLVGSLATGLLMTHRDIDFHIYTDTLDIAADFMAMSELASVPGMKSVTYTNLLDEPDVCLEWHAWYELEGDVWQLDMIHILKGSAYDGYFEKVAARIKETATEEERLTILTLKYKTPKDIKISGIEYYQAVMRDGVREFEEFQAWRKKNITGGIIEWMP